VLSNNTSGHWVIRLNRGEEMLRLVCFPYAGGSSQMFHSWVLGLPPRVGLYGVQLPGRGRRLQERSLDRLAPIVGAVVDALAPLGDLPLVLFGHSMGALVAFEVARALRDSLSVTPARLIVSAYSAPHIPRRAAPIHHLPRSQFIMEIRDLRGTPAEIFEDPELLDLLLPAVRADFAVIETYEPKTVEPLDCPVLALGGLDDSLFSHQDLEAWRENTRSKFTLHMLPGDHFFIKNLAPQIVALISHELEHLIGPVDKHGDVMVAMPGDAS